MDASTMLHEAVNTNNKEKESADDEIIEAPGFLGSFNTKLENKNKEQIEKNEIDKEVENLNLHSKIDSEFAPKMALTAVGEVLESIGN